MKKMIKIISVLSVLISIIFILYVSIGLLTFTGWGPFVGVEESHVISNVPDDLVFDEYLQRDLSLYFEEIYGTEGSVTYELLLDHPSQSGLAFPKYYVWTSVELSSGRLTGIVRVAAIDKSYFDVIDFFQVSEIVSEPEIVCASFSSDLCEEIKRRAAE